MGFVVDPSILDAEGDIDESDEQINKGGAVHSLSHKWKCPTFKTSEDMHLFCFFHGKAHQQGSLQPPTLQLLAAGPVLLTSCIEEGGQPADLSSTAQCMLDAYQGKRVLTHQFQLEWQPVQPRAIAVLRCNPPEAPGDDQKVGFATGGGRIYCSGCSVSIGDSAWVKAYVLFPQRP